MTRPAAEIIDLASPVARMLRVSAGPIIMRCAWSPVCHARRRDPASCENWPPGEQCLMVRHGPQFCVHCGAQTCAWDRFGTPCCNACEAERNRRGYGVE